MSFRIVDNHIELDKVGRTKKLTATRFATVMGLNEWSTPFEAWCEITKTWESPFEESIYTKAGKIIEPIIINHLNRRYFMNLKTPEDIYGKDYFKQTWGDFFKEEKIFGGMWDALGENFILEIKTTKRVEDWEDDVPIYYDLQAALYAYLKGFKHYYVAVAFLEPNDYNYPEKFTPTLDNFKIYHFVLDEKYPDFEEDYIKPALEWWEKHVVTGISPDFDLKKDKDIIDDLRKNVIEITDDNITTILSEYDQCLDYITHLKGLAEEKEKRIKELETKIKDYMENMMVDGKDKVEIKSAKYSITLAKSRTQTIDKDALKKAGILDHYMTVKETTRLTKKAI